MAEVWQPFITKNIPHLYGLEFTGRRLLEAGRKEAELYGRRREGHLFRYQESWLRHQATWQLGDADEHLGLQIVSRPRSLIMDIYTSQKIKGQPPIVVHTIGHLSIGGCYLESYDNDNPESKTRDLLDPGSPAIDSFRRNLADFIDRSGLILYPAEPPIVGQNRKTFGDNL